MIKEHIVTKVSERLGATKAEAASIVEAILDSIIEILKEGKKIEIREFGTFRVVDRKAKIGRIISSGEPVHIPPRKGAKFIPGRILKELVNARPLVDNPGAGRE